MVGNVEFIVFFLGQINPASLHSSHSLCTGEETGKFPSNHLEEIKVNLFCFIWYLFTILIFGISSFYLTLKAAGFCDDQVSQKPRLAAVRNLNPLSLYYILGQKARTSP